VSAFVQRKEFAGQVRAMGMVGFSTGAFSPEAYQSFLRVVTLQDSQAAVFERNASGSQQAIATEILKGPIVDGFISLGAIGVAASTTPDRITDVTGEKWFEASTKYIDLLKAAEDRLVSDFLAQTRAVTNEVRVNLWTVAGIVAVMLLVTSGLAF